ncbi:hypothetical protein [Synechocystis sp. PCC 7509]|uniref:hypothetical protein n=1 Tax=Synechocystis sp. PCC 7509 TaxID=927677 RepID=UPI0002AC1A51|nr:hypothetical protein [Synechocystis sp. PCC 7509]
MNIGEFLEMSLDELESVSGIEKTRWCKYFNGGLMNERNIYRFAASVEMTAGEFLDALNQKRKSLRALKMKNVEVISGSQHLFTTD